MRTEKWIKLPALFLAVGLAATACSSDGGGGDEDATETSTDTGAEGGDAGQSTLDVVKERGTLICGINGQVPGFSFIDESGEISGFDADYCKAVAAAVLGDPTAVEYKELDAKQRFTALQAGEIDVLIRNTTWTASRDGGEGGSFAVTTFYDGQGMMVKSDAGVSSLADLSGATICVLQGTTTEQNLTTVSEAEGLDLQAQTFEDNEALQAAFEAGQCQGWTSDKSQLAAVRSNFPEEQGGPEALTILDETISKEPLGPVTQDGDTEWYDAVNWTVIATILAEELGIDSTNIDSMTESENPEIQRFLGVSEGEPFDPGLGLPADFAVQVIKAVGNYEEIYNRNVGPDTPLGLSRGLNELWTEGGILYAPPYR